MVRLRVREGAGVDEWQYPDIQVIDLGRYDCAQIGLVVSRGVWIVDRVRISLAGWVSSALLYPDGSLGTLKSGRPGDYSCFSQDVTGELDVAARRRGFDWSASAVREDGGDQNANGGRCGSNGAASADRTFGALPLVSFPITERELAIPLMRINYGARTRSAQATRAMKSAMWSPEMTIGWPTANHPLITSHFPVLSAVATPRQC